MPGSLEEISWKNELTILLIFVKVTLISNIKCMFFTINFHLLNIFESSVKVRKIKWSRLHGEVEVMVISMMVIRFLQVKVGFEGRRWCESSVKVKWNRIEAKSFNEQWVSMSFLFWFEYFTQNRFKFWVTLFTHRKTHAKSNGCTHTQNTLPMGGVYVGLSVFVY